MWTKNVSLSSEDRLFQGIKWGTSTVYQEQVTTAKYLDLSVTTLSKELQDVVSSNIILHVSVFRNVIGKEML